MISLRQPQLARILPRQRFGSQHTGAFQIRSLSNAAWTGTSVGSTRSSQAQLLENGGWLGCGISASEQQHMELHTLAKDAAPSNAVRYAEGDRYGHHIVLAEPAGPPRLRLGLRVPSAVALVLCRQASSVSMGCASSQQLTIL